MSAWKGGSTRAWRKLRALVLAANLETNEGRCRLGVLDVCTRRATTAHHTHGRAVTGDDRRFVVAACTACNLHIRDPQTHDPDCEACAHITLKPARRGSPQPRPMTKW